MHIQLQGRVHPGEQNSEGVNLRCMLPLLSHQGGWDEILLFVAPIALAFFVIRALERRGKTARDAQEEESQKTVP